MIEEYQSIMKNDVWDVVPVIAQVVGWEKPDPTINWRQLRGNLPTVTLGRCLRHFKDEVVTSRGESR
jgi:hypothetical protein